MSVLPQLHGTTSSARTEPREGGGAAGSALSSAVPTDPRRAQEILRRLELIGQSAGIGFWSLQRQPAQTYWGRQLYELHGLSPTQPPPDWRTWLRRHVHPEDRQLVSHSLARWLREGGAAHELGFRLVHADGSLRHVVAHLLMDGEHGRQRPFGLLIDVSEQQAALAASRRSDGRAHLIAHSLGVGTWEHDLLTDAATWDEQMWRLRGREPQAQAPDGASRNAMVHAADQAMMQEIFQRSLRNAGPLEYEFRVRWPDGSWRWLASRSTTEVNAQGQAVRRIGLNWDITEARMARAAQQEKRDAQRELRAKLQFLSRMSHELRTPLNAMLGFAQLLEVDDGRGDAETRLQRLQQIRHAGQHLLALIDDVLDLSRLEGGEMSIVSESVSVRTLVQSALPLVERLAEDQGVHLRQGRLEGQVLADPTRLRQVLLNLLTNAIKYNRPGGEVCVQAHSEDNVSVLRVSDTGRGISAEQRQHLFDPFNRLGAERSAVQGTGIGLAIVKALVERMGGTVHVESTPGAGSCFELRLRDGQAESLLREGAASAEILALAAVSRPPAPAQAGRILYVEDNPVNAMIVVELVSQRGGLEIRTAETGTEGVQVAREWLPELVLLDMQLPDIGGEQVFAELRADARTAAIPCIALSANAMPTDIARARHAGFSDYWTKPLDFRVFHTAIEALFGPAPPR